MCLVAQGCEETHHNQQTMSADNGKQQQDNRGSNSDRYTSSINDDSARRKQLEDEIAKTNFDPNFNATYWRIDDIKLVVNKRLTKQYLCAREDLQRQGLNENELQEVLLFSTEKDRRVGEICRDGARVGHKRRHVLGHTGSGIHLVRHFDILARYMAFQQCFSPATIVVYKCILGRQKPIYPRLQKDDNHLTPHALFDSHVSSRPVEPCMHIEEALNCSYVYLYQLDGASGCPRKFPRQVLPYAILTAYKKHPVMITDTMLAVDHSDITCRWEVKGETRSGYRFNFVKLKRKKRKQSTQSPLSTIGKLKGQLLEMRTKDHSNGKSFPTSPKASDVLESGLPGCIVRLERLKPSDIEKFVRMETPNTHSGNKTDTDSHLLCVDSSKDFDDNAKQIEASLSKECSNVCNVTEAQLALKEISDTDETQSHESTTEKLAEQRQDKSPMQNSIPKTVSPSLGEAAPDTLDILPMIQEAENIDIQLGEKSKGSHQASDRESEVSKTQSHEKAVDGVTLEAEPMLSKELQRQSGYKTDGTSDIDDKENTYSDHFTERCMAERLPLHSVFNHCDLDVHRTCSAVDKENQMNDDNQIPKQIDISTALKVRNFLSAKYKSVCFPNTPNENEAQSDKTISNGNDKTSYAYIVGSALSGRKDEVNKNKVVDQENVQLFENLSGLNVTVRDDSDAETVVGGLNDVDELLNLEEKSYQMIQQTYVSQNQNAYDKHNNNNGIVETQIKHEQNDTVQDPLVDSNCFEEDTNRQENMQNDLNIECDKTNECRKSLASDAIIYTFRGVKSEPGVEYQRPQSFRIENELVSDFENVKPTNGSLPHQQKNKTSISEEQAVCFRNEAATTTPFQRLDINVKIEHSEINDCDKVTSEKHHDKHPNEQEEPCLPVKSSSIFSHFRRSLASTSPALTMKILQSEIANAFTLMKSKQAEIESKEENVKDRHISNLGHFSSVASKCSEKMHTVMRKRKLSRDNVEDSPKRLLVATICKQVFHESQMNHLSANNANCTQSNSYRDKNDQQVLNDKKDVEIASPPFDKSQNISASVTHCTLSEARKDKTDQQISKDEEDTTDERTLGNTLLVLQNIIKGKGNVNAETAVCQHFDKSRDASASSVYGTVFGSCSDETDQQVSKDEVDTGTIGELKLDKSIGSNLSVPHDIMKESGNVNAETAVCQYFDNSHDASARNALRTISGPYSDETDQQVSKDEVDTGTLGERKLDKSIGNNLSVPHDIMKDSGNVNAETAVCQYFDKSRDASANNAHGAVPGSYRDETDQQVSKDEIELPVPNDIMKGSDNVNAESEPNQSSDNSHLSANNSSFTLSNSYSKETDKINSQNRKDAVTVEKRTLGSKLLLPQDFMKGSDSLYAEPTVNQIFYEPHDSIGNEGTVSVDDSSPGVNEKSMDKIHATQIVYKLPVYRSTSISQFNIQTKPSEISYLKGIDTFQRSDLANKCGEVAMPINSIDGSSLSPLPRDTMKGSDTLQAEPIYDSTPGCQNTSISILSRIDTKPSESAHLETNGAQRVSCVAYNCVEGGLSLNSTSGSVENGNFEYETLVRTENSNQQSHSLEAASSSSASIQPLTAESSTRVHNTSDSETGQKISVICCNRSPTSNNLALSGRPLLDFRCMMKKKGKKKRRKCNGFSANRIGQAFHQGSVKANNSCTPINRASVNVSAVPANHSQNSNGRNSPRHHRIAHDRMSDNIRQRNGLGFGMRNSKGFNGIHMRRVNDRPRLTYREFQSLKMRYEIRNRIRNAFSEYHTFDSMRGKEAAILLSELARTLVSNYDDIVREDGVRRKEPENVRRHQHVQRAMTDSYGSRNETNDGARRSFTDREHQRRHLVHRATHQPRSESRTGKLLPTNEHTKDKRRRVFDEKYRNLGDNRKPAFDNERRCSKHSSNESRHSRHRERYNTTRPAEDVLSTSRMHISTQRQKKIRIKSPEKIHHSAKEIGCPRREEESARGSSNETLKKKRSSRMCLQSRSKSPEKIHHSTKERNCSPGEEESATGSVTDTLKKKQSRLCPESRSKSPEKIQHYSKDMDCLPREKSAKGSCFETLKKKQSRLCPESQSKSPEKIQHSPKEMDCPPREKSAKGSCFETFKKKQSRLCPESRSKSPEKIQHSPKEMDCPPREKSAKGSIFETFKKKQSRLCPESRSKTSEKIHRSPKEKDCPSKEEESARRLVIEAFEKKRHRMSPKNRSKSPEKLHHSAKEKDCSRRDEKSANGSVIKTFEKKRPTLCPKSRRHNIYKSHSDEEIESDKEQISPSDKSTRYKKWDIEEMRHSHTKSFVNKYTDPKGLKPCTVGFSRSKDSDNGNNTSDTDDCDINRSRRLKRRVEVADDLLSLKRHKSPDADIELSSGNSRVSLSESQDLKYDGFSSRRPGSNNEHECRNSGKVRRLDDLREHIDVRRHEGLRKGIVTRRDEERQRDVEMYEYDKDTLRISVEFGRSVEMCRDTDLLRDVELQRDTKMRRDVDLRRDEETRRELKLYKDMKERSDFKWQRDVKTCQEVSKSKPIEVYKESKVFGKDSKDRHNPGANSKIDANDRTNSTASKTAETGNPIPVISLRSTVQGPYPLAY